LVTLPVGIKDHRIEQQFPRAHGSSTITAATLCDQARILHPGIEAPQGVVCENNLPNQYKWSKIDLESPPL
jgi:hypothetical protein